MIFKVKIISAKIQHFFQKPNSANYIFIKNLFRLSDKNCDMIDYNNFAKNNYLIFDKLRFEELKEFI